MGELDYNITDIMHDQVYLENILRVSVRYWMLTVTSNDISVIYLTAHRCAGGLKKKLDLWSGFQRHRHFVGLFNVPVQAPTRDQPFIRLFLETAPFSRLLRHACDTEDTFST